MRRTPFVIALNKIDRLYGWKPIHGNSFIDSYKHQDSNVKGEFKTRLQ